MNLQFDWLEPSRPKDAIAYSCLKTEVLDALVRGYGETAYSRELHDHRLCHEDQHLCIVRSQDLAGKILACSYVRADGKRGGTAVLPEFRNLRIGTSLVNETLKRIPCQFGEVSIENQTQIDLLARCGFSISSDPDFIVKTLASLGPLVEGFFNAGSTLGYSRRSRDNQNLLHRFFFMHTFDKGNLMQLMQNATDAQ